jgi:hypothetical protein
MLLGRPRSYRDIWIGLALALPVLVAIWFIAGAVPASGLAVVAVIGLARDVRHVRYRGTPPPAWPESAPPPARGD